MTVEALLNSLMVSGTNSLGLLDLVLAMGIPFLLSFVITFVYRSTQRHNNYSTAFVHTIFLFSSLSSIITLLIGSNIARAFGLLGALSIIRFRNALKDPLDAVYIFWALAVGMACGTGFYLAAFVLVAFCAGAVYFLHFTGYGKPKYVDSVMKIFTSQDKEQDAIPEAEKLLANQTKNCRQVNVLFDSAEQSKAYVYSLRAKKGTDYSKIESSLGSIAGISKVHHLNKESSLFVD